MKSKKILAALFATAFIFVLLSALMTVGISAEPYAEHNIVPDNKTIIVATDFDSGVYEKAPASGNKDIRPDEEVNTEIGGSEFGGNIGWIAAGDWVQYTVNVAQDGKYRVEAWLASDADPTGGIKLYYNDVEVGTSENSSRDGWQVYDLYFVADVEMTAGEGVLKTEYTGGINVAAFEITPLGANGNPIWIPTELRVSASGNNIIRAVDFDSGVYGKAPADGAKDIRTNEEVNTEVGESEFGGNIGWIAAGDWVQYTVNVQRDGRYNFGAWLASDADPTGGVKIYCDDVEIGTSPNSAKNGWQAYDLYSVGETNITTGEHVIKVEFTGGVNFSALEITRTGNIEVPEEEAPPPAEDEETPPAEDTDDTGSGAEEPSDSGEGISPVVIVIIIVAVIAVAVVAFVIVKNKKK